MVLSILQIDKYLRMKGSIQFLIPRLRSAMAQKGGRGV